MTRQQGENRTLTRDSSTDGGRSFDLEDLDHLILDHLQEGARTQAYILDEIPDEYSRHQVRERFKILATIGAVKKLHDQTALYELNYDPREQDNGEADQ